MPWGTEFTGMMVALVSWDGRVIGQAKEILFATQCTRLIVSHYTKAEVSNRQFKGAVFNRGLGVNGEGVWERNACPTALVLTAEGGELPTRDTPQAAEVIIEDFGLEEDGARIRWQWIRLSAASALVYYARFMFSVIITAGDLSDDMFSKLLAESKKNGYDPLRFGLATFESASWIYVPETPRVGDEVYINRDPQETSKLLADERIASAPQFVLRCFC
jgi:hypothetical protein